MQYTSEDTFVHDVEADAGENYPTKKQRKRKPRVKTEKDLANASIYNRRYYEKNREKLLQNMKAYNERKKMEMQDADPNYIIRNRGRPCKYPAGKDKYPIVVEEKS